ncbi:MAG: RNA-binding protein [uncultured bacterium]|nr:MAG: RNA-binding protein [uncultured bacterium]OGH14882.1 MAG: RNA-binding protein [Candidatus Levybacteria bacterium RIFCSPHIGHO2_01_FULL_38_26]
MSTRLFVGRLSYGTTDEQLEQHFSQAGKVISAKAIVDRYSGQGKGFGFVEMATAEEAQKAIQQLNNSNLNDRSIVVNEARPREERPQGQNQSRSW